jgi:hypothetical protein
MKEKFNEIQETKRFQDAIKWCDYLCEYFESTEELPPCYTRGECYSCSGMEYVQDFIS